MTSVNCGAFVSLKKKIPHVVHLLCLNHTSNLSLLMSFKSSNDIIFAIELLSDLKSFFKMSPKVDAELRKFLEKKNYSKLMDYVLQDAIYSLCTLNWVTIRIDPLDKILQNSLTNHIEGTQAVQAMMSNMKKQISSGCENVFEKVNFISNTIGIVFKGNRDDLFKQMPLKDILANEIFFSNQQ